MYNEFMKDKLRVWQVQFNSKETGRYVDNHTLNVTARTLEEALQKVKDKYPNGKILNVNHKGHIDL